MTGWSTLCHRVRCGKQLIFRSGPDCMKKTCDACLAGALQYTRLWAPVESTVLPGLYEEDLRCLFGGRSSVHEAVGTS